MLSLGDVLSVLGDVVLGDMVLGDVVLGDVTLGAALLGDVVVVSALGVVALGAAMLGDVVVGALGADGVVVEFGVPVEVPESDEVDCAYTMPPATANAAAEPIKIDFMVLM